MPARDLLEVLQLEAAKRQQEDTNRLVALANARAEQLERDRQQERATMDQRLEASRQVRIAMPFSGPSAVLLRRCAAILPRASRSHCACVKPAALSGNRPWHDCCSATSASAEVPTTNCDAGPVRGGVGGSAAT